MEARKDKYQWNHPIPLYLLEAHQRQTGILEIIDRETEYLLDSLRIQRPGIFSTEVATPIEKMLEALEIDVTNLKHSGALGITGRTGGTINIKLNRKVPYFRQRFTLAHELAHVWLQQRAGPFTFDELAKTKDNNQEEEFLCDVFAAALLMPKAVLLPYLKEPHVNKAMLHRIANDFKVSISAVLRRVAGVRNAILLFWSEIVNPLNRQSEKAERIEFVYPTLKQLSKYFVPLYCTARDARFDPNIIVRSLEQEADISSRVTIRGFGSLPDGSYTLHNVFFNRWSKRMYSIEGFEESRRRCDMVTFIELDATCS